MGCLKKVKGGGPMKKGARRGAVLFFSHGGILKR